jgi:K+-sensing histidine kinase KdpD
MSTYIETVRGVGYRFKINLYNMTENQSVMEMLQDMRSPLAALMVGIEMLEKQKIGTMNKSQLELMACMHESVEKLKRVIDLSIASKYRPQV